MALNLDAVGKKLGPASKDYTWKDVALYALGVGAGFQDLAYCYEKNLKVIPTFSIAAIFDFLPQFAAAANVDLAGILHGEQELIFHAPLPTSGTLVTEGKITHMYDKGAQKGALIVGESETRDADGQKLFTSILTLFSRRDGGFGGENAPAEAFTYPDRAPDAQLIETPSENQPLLYRLSGDVFPLHADPEFAKMAGFERPIMHGLCTLGYACRALMNVFTPGAPEKVRRLKCRFSKPLMPGDPITIQIWKTGEGSAAWKTINAKTKEEVITNGLFEFGDIPKAEIRFDGRVAVITGAGGGLGRVYALELARRGAKIVVNDLGGARDGSGPGSATPAQKVVDEITSLGGEAAANYDSVATPEGGERIIRAAVETFGTVDILINNAGILRDKSFMKMDAENWNIIQDVHLNGAFHVSRAAFAVMREKGYGRILMTTSAAGLYGNFGQTNYASAKMGLVGFMNALKLEGRKYNIKVNTIAPLAASRLTEDFMPPEIFAKMKPEFVCPMVVYLCSENCAVTGNIYNAGMGFFNRAAVVTGPGVVIGSPDHAPTVEDIAENHEAIASLKHGKVYFELNEQVGDLINAFSAKPTAAASPQQTMTVADIFAAMPASFNASAATGVDVVFQYRISGPGGGDWHCKVKDGACAVTKGVHEKPTCTLKISDADFISMISGALPAMKAYTSGKLKIEGDIMKSQLIEKLFRS